MSADRCPNCQAPLTEREVRERWCNECGTSLPELITTTPSALPVTGDEGDRPRPYDWAERDLSLGPTPDQDAARKQASSILFLIAALQFVCGGILVFALSEEGARGPADSAFLAILLAEWLAVMLAFVGLGWWARYQPLPPVVLGLIIYLVLWLVGAVFEPGTAGQGIILRIAVIVGLVRAIRVAAKAR
jgi:hypothetical protein